MKKQFTEKDLVDFGNYLSSDLRKDRYIAIDSEIPAIERLSKVSDADIQNFKQALKKKK